MSAPTMDDVRALLQRDIARITPPLSGTIAAGRDLGFDAQCYRVALAALDDAERLEWLLGWLRQNHWIVAHHFGGDPREMRTGIDAARREGA